MTIVASVGSYAPGASGDFKPSQPSSGFKPNFGPYSRAFFTLDDLIDSKNLPDAPSKEPKEDEQLNDDDEVPEDAAANN